MKYLQQFVTTSLNVGGGINASQTTGIVLQSLNNVDATKPSVACISWADPLSTSVAEWVTYTSINSTTNTLQGVTRGAEGYSAKTHSNGATVAFPLSKAHVNELNDALLVEHTAAGVHNLPSTSPIYNSSLSRQAIINGNFDVWQRGTSVSTPDVTFTYLADRWCDFVEKNGGTLPTLTRSRQAITPGEVSNSFYTSRMAFNGAGTSLGNISQHTMFQRIENGTRLLCGNGKTVTVSFYAKSDVTSKKIRVSLTQSYGSGGSPSATEQPSGATILTLTSSWVKYTVTFTTITLTGKTFGTANDDFLQLDIRYMWGTGIESPAEAYVGAGYVDIAQVQLCAGSVALPFQPKSFEEELRACQRYFEKGYKQAEVPGANVSTSHFEQFNYGHATSSQRTVSIPFKVTKRLAPTMAIYDIAGNVSKVSTIDEAGSGWTNNVAYTGTSVGEQSFAIYKSATTVGGLGFQWTASIEL